jgi:alpha-ketoglutarate-dependent taurine dioxygenase
VAPGEAFPLDTAFHHVIPQPGHADTPAVNHGAGDFPFHQDRIFLEAQPEYHFLAGVRVGNDPCSTVFMDGRALLAGLPAEVEDALHGPDYEDPVTGKRVAVLRVGASGSYLGVDLQPGWMRPLTPEAEAALDHLHRRSAALTAPDVLSVLSGPGDLVIHDHRRLLHGRERLQPDVGRPENVRWWVRVHGVY